MFLWQCFRFISDDRSKCKLSLVTDIKAPKFVNSSFKASKRSVSFIFKVCKPVKLQEIPSEKQVTAIVCAISGAFLRFIAKVSAVGFTFFF